MQSEAGENRDRLAWALGIGRDSLTHIGSEQDGVWTLARHMQQAVWPATGGYLFQYLLPEAMSEHMRGILEKHFLEFVRAKGPLPLLRIGKQPVRGVAGHQNSRVEGLSV